MLPTAEVIIRDIYQCREHCIVMSPHSHHVGPVCPCTCQEIHRWLRSGRVSQHMVEAERGNSSQSLPPDRIQHSRGTLATSRVIDFAVAELRGWRFQQVTSGACTPLPLSSVWASTTGLVRCAHARVGGSCTPPTFLFRTGYSSAVEWFWLLYFRSVGSRSLRVYRA